MLQSDKAGKADFPALKVTLSWFLCDHNVCCLVSEGHGKSGGALWRIRVPHAYIGIPGAKFKRFP